MTIHRNNFDGGTNGTGGTGRITPANSAGSGDALALLVDTASQRWNYAAHPLAEPGLVAYRTNDTTSGHIRGHEANPTGRGGLRRTFYLPNRPSGDAVFAQIRTAAETNMGSVQVQSNGRIAVNQGAGVGWISASESSSALPLDEKLALEFFQTPASPATGGVVELYVFDDTDTDLWSWSGTTTTNTNPPAQFRFGGFSSSEGLAYDWMDEVAWGSLASGLFGPEPNDDAGPDQTVEPWSIVTLAGTGNGPWSQVSGTPVTLAGSGDTRTFVAPPAWGNEELVFAYGTDTCKVTVLTATDFFITGTGPKPFYNEMVH